MGNQLVFKNWGTPLMGLFVLVMSVIFLTTFGRSTHLACGAEERYCELTRSAPFGIHESTEGRYPLEEIQQATLGESRNSDGDRTYSANLQLDDSSVDILGYSRSGRSGVQSIVDEVNTGLDDVRQGGDFHMSHQVTFGLWMPLAMSVLGLYLLLFQRNVVALWLPPGVDQLQVAERRWWQPGSPGKIRDIPLQDISRVAVETTWSRSQRSGHSKPAHRPVIYLKSGESIPLTRTRRSGQGAFRRQEQVRRFLEQGGASLDDEPDDPA
ncbi:hypothetical protein [Thioalkalivibrio sp. ALE23]|uniref:hypothetical protein n=1 Tax=Thioalkalivibrio sp. ALE23 TaxID=1265495 RepID=UPI00037F2BB4|nr:hypothetical protein [Thioalkalivibrio sp. ALE23]